MEPPAAIEPPPSPILAESPTRSALRDLVSPTPVTEEEVPVPVTAAVEVAPAPAPVVVEAAAPAPAADVAPPAPGAAPTPAAAPARAAVFAEDDLQDRRASLKRRAVMAGSAPAAPPEAPSAMLEPFDTVEAAADLAAELERALSQAADANEALRRDLGMALDDLSRSTADNKRLHERVERLEGESRERASVVQDLLQEMEMLESERDTALTQASESSLSTDELNEKLVLAERRVHDAERALADAQSRSRRFEEQVQLHLAQRTALRAEVDSLRRERDGMVTRIAELEREHTDLNRSRQALDEVHRALNEARQRAQRIRSR
jgi:DNA repair exonuclease SbcCD ATPase subunit